MRFLQVDSLLKPAQTIRPDLAFINGTAQVACATRMLRDLLPELLPRFDTTFHNRLPVSETVCKADVMWLQVLLASAVFVVQAPKQWTKHSSKESHSNCSTVVKG